MTTTTTRAPRRVPTLGFGFDPGDSGRHFLLRVVPGAENAGNVVLEEHLAFSFGEHDGASTPERPDLAPIVKASLDADRWARLAPAVADAFNARLRTDGQRAGRWVPSGETLLDRRMGQELALLLWAAEGAPVEAMAAVLANWGGLAPEERWWFSHACSDGMALATPGKPTGWRRAIQVAFVENPIEAAPAPPRVPAPVPARKTNATAPTQRGLFDEDDGAPHAGEEVA
jgi:hypothetical protein